MKEDKLRILLAEDHAIVREGLKSLLNAQTDMTVIAEASDGQEALASVKELHPDIIVMDISMPNVNGLKALKKIKEINPKAKVLMLTRHTDAGFLHQLFQAGASGYVLKQSASDELIRAIHAVAQGKHYLDPAVTEKVTISYAHRHADLRPEQQGNLSEREEAILRRIAWGYSNKEIAAHFEISVKTVEAHKANIMKKLGLHSRIDIVRYAVLQGWLQDN